MGMAWMDLTRRCRPHAMTAACFLFLTTWRLWRLLSDGSVNHVTAAPLRALQACLARAVPGCASHHACRRARRCAAQEDAARDAAFLAERKLRACHALNAGGAHDPLSRLVTRVLELGNMLVHADMAMIEEARALYKLYKCWAALSSTRRCGDTNAPACKLQRGSAGPAAARC